VAQLTQFGEQLGGLTARPGWVWDPEISEATREDVRGESPSRERPSPTGNPAKQAG
jgi:hypothetical protein